MLRKKAERKKRCSAGKAATSLFSSSREPGDSAILLGVLSFVSGISDKDELFGVAEKCRRCGMDFLFNLKPGKKSEISSRPLEAEMKCSSLPLCT